MDGIDDGYRRNIGTDGGAIMGAQVDRSTRDTVPITAALRASLGVLAIALVLACTVPSDGEGDGDGGQPPGSSTGDRPRDGQRGEPPTAEEFKQDISDAVTSAEAYWTEVFNRSQRRFTPIRQVIAYTEEGEVSCGGEPVPRNNAVYCPAGDFIAYDVNFAVNAFARVGDAFLYYLLGHEYGHGIQVRLGIEYQFTIEQELQADCMAGAYIGDSVKAGALELADGDLEEFREGLLAVGDDPDVPWFAPGAHGTAQQRTGAFFDGYEDSLSPCGLT
jgi:uncharacterized protein